MKNGVLPLEKLVPSVKNYTEEKEFYVNGMHNNCIMHQYSMLAVDANMCNFR